MLFIFFFFFRYVICFSCYFDCKDTNLFFFGKILFSESPKNNQPNLIPKSAARAILPTLAGGFQAFVQLALQQLI